MQGRETAVLQCGSCGEESEHVVQYAGRVLVFTKCLNCQLVWHHNETDLRSAYAHDLSSRVATKPRRWVRRLRRRPLKTVLELPAAMVAQPAKFVREVLAVLRR